MRGWTLAVCAICMHHLHLHNNYTTDTSHSYCVTKRIATLIVAAAVFSMVYTCLQRQAYTNDLLKIRLKRSAQEHGAAILLMTGLKGSGTCSHVNTHEHQFVRPMYTCSCLAQQITVGGALLVHLYIVAMVCWHSLAIASGNR